jgi:hypothetical protein
MGLAQSVRVAYEPIRTIEYTEFVDGVLVVGDNPVISHPVRELKAYNFTDQNVFISYDGINIVDIIPSKGAFVDDFSSNKSDAGGILELPAGSYVWVMGETDAPTLGNVYIVVIYASSN